jgi:hypothetical protein
MADLCLLCGKPGDGEHYIGTEDGQTFPACGWRCAQRWLREVQRRNAPTTQALHPDPAEKGKRRTARTVTQRPRAR